MARQHWMAGLRDYWQLIAGILAVGAGLAATRMRLEAQDQRLDKVESAIVVVGEMAGDVKGLVRVQCRKTRDDAELAGLDCRALRGNSTGVPVR